MIRRFILMFINCIHKYRIKLKTPPKKTKKYKNHPKKSLQKIQKGPKTEFFSIFGILFVFGGIFVLFGGFLFYLGDLCIVWGLISFFWGIFVFFGGKNSGAIFVFFGYFFVFFRVFFVFFGGVFNMITNYKKSLFVFIIN